MEGTVSYHLIRPNHTAVTSNGLDFTVYCVALEKYYNPSTGDVVPQHISRPNGDAGLSCGCGYALLTAGYPSLDPTSPRPSGNWSIDVDGYGDECVFVSELVPDAKIIRETPILRKGDLPNTPYRNDLWDLIAYAVTTRDRNMELS